MGLPRHKRGRGDGPADVTAAQGRKRLIGLDSARGLALIGLMAIHIFPSENETGDPTLAWELFSGDSAALFALLAGVGLALSSGGQRPHRERRMAGDRLALVARAFLIGVVALVVAAFMPSDPPAFGILLYYSMFFLLAIPFLHLGPRTLFLSAAVFGIVSPLLLQKLGPVLPETSDFNHTLTNLVFEPAGVASELLLSGSYPALTYMCYILTGMGVGRLDLRKPAVQGYLVAFGAGLAILANMASTVLLDAMGGYEQLLDTPGMSVDSLDEALIFGPAVVPDTSAWWLAIATPHTNMPLAIASSLGIALLVTGLFLLIERAVTRPLRPLAAMGAMTLTLYSAHLLALSLEVHYEEHVLWFIVHLAVAMAFGMIWSQWLGQGPLERTVTAAAKNFRQIVDDGPAGGSAALSGTVSRSGHQPFPGRPR
ncbi:MAG: heparan-alpha-glucosaminide N-acetyltransferase domain-containing protein [Actinomycetota bacterium]